MQGLRVIHKAYFLLLYWVTRYVYSPHLYLPAPQGPLPEMKIAFDLALPIRDLEFFLEYPRGRQFIPCKT